MFSPRARRIASLFLVIAVQQVHSADFGAHGIHADIGHSSAAHPTTMPETAGSHIATAAAIADPYLTIREKLGSTKDHETIINRYIDTTLARMQAVPESMPSIEHAILTTTTGNQIDGYKATIAQNQIKYENLVNKQKELQAHNTPAGDAAWLAFQNAIKAATTAKAHAAGARAQITRADILPSLQTSLNPAEQDALVQKLELEDIQQMLNYCNAVRDNQVEALKAHLQETISLPEWGPSIFSCKTAADKRALFAKLIASRAIHQGNMADQLSADLLKEEKNIATAWTAKGVFGYGQEAYAYNYANLIIKRTTNEQLIVTYDAIIAYLNFSTSPDPARAKELTSWFTFREKYNGVINAINTHRSGLDKKAAVETASSSLPADQEIHDAPIDAAIRDYLKRQDIDSDKLNHYQGTSYEVELFQENAFIMKTSAQLADLGIVNDELQNCTEAALNFSDAAIDLLHQHDTTQASALTDLASAFLDEAIGITTGISKGMAKGVLDTLFAPVDLGVLAYKGFKAIGGATLSRLNHPIDTCTRLAAGIGKLISCAYEISQGDFSKPRGTAAAAGSVAKSIGSYIKEEGKKFLALPVEQQAESVTRLLFGIFGGGKIQLARTIGFNKGMSALSKICGAEAKTVRRTIAGWGLGARLAWGTATTELAVFKGIYMYKEAYEAMITTAQRMERVFETEDALAHLTRVGATYIKSAKVTATVVQTITSEQKILNALQTAKEYLGENVRVIINEYGDRVFLSRDGLRRIRFDIMRPYPHNNVHGHVERLANKKWLGSGQIYPTDVPHN